MKDRDEVPFDVLESSKVGDEFFRCGKEACSKKHLVRAIDARNAKVLDMSKVRGKDHFKRKNGVGVGSVPWPW